MFRNLACCCSWELQRRDTKQREGASDVLEWCWGGVRGAGLLRFVLTCCKRRAQTTLSSDTTKEMQPFVCGLVTFLVELLSISNVPWDKRIN